MKEYEIYDHITIQEYDTIMYYALLLHFVRVWYYLILDRFGEMDSTVLPPYSKSTAGTICLYEYVCSEILSGILTKMRQSL